MFEVFLPDIVCSGIFDIPESFYTEYDIRAVILDIDNTLVEDGQPMPDDYAIKFIEMLNAKGIRIAIVSNNNEERVKKFVSGLNKDNIAYFYKSHKPLKSSLSGAVSLLGQEISHIAMIGDQILTDVIAAKRNGITAVYVKPINIKAENFLFKIKRAIERPLLGIYYKKHNGK